jgi:hypothetical protein
LTNIVKIPSPSSALMEANKLEEIGDNAVDTATRYIANALPTRAALLPLVVVVVLARMVACGYGANPAPREPLTMLKAACSQNFTESDVRVTVYQNELCFTVDSGRRRLINSPVDQVYSSIKSVSTAKKCISGLVRDERQVCNIALKNNRLVSLASDYVLARGEVLLTEAEEQRVYDFLKSKQDNAVINCLGGREVSIGGKRYSYGRSKFICGGSSCVSAKTYAKLRVIKIKLWTHPDKQTVLCLSGVCVTPHHLLMTSYGARTAHHICKTTKCEVRKERVVSALFPQVDLTAHLSLTPFSFDGYRAAAALLSVIRLAWCMVTVVAFFGLMHELLGGQAAATTGEGSGSTAIGKPRVREISG